MPFDFIPMTNDPNLPPPEPPDTIQREIFREVAIQGRTPEDIARQRSLSVEQVERIVRRVERYLAVEQMRQDPEQVKLTHLGRLEHQWREVMNAWYRSLEKDRIVKVIEDAKTKEKQKIEHTIRDQTGDVRYLEQARRIMAEMRGVVGAVDPLQQDKEDLLDVRGLTSKQRRAELARRLTALRQRQREEESERAGDGNDG